jgi:5-hydroxyisourate hydrolase
VVASLSTHVLDTSTGRPAAGVAASLHDATGASLADAVTDADGRVAALGGDLDAGPYRLTFAVGDYFSATGTDAFYPRVVVEFRVTGDGGEAWRTERGGRHYHVPLLVSPFGYTTYRGS